MKQSQINAADEVVKLLDDAQNLVEKAARWVKQYGLGSGLLEQLDQVGANIDESMLWLLEDIAKANEAESGGPIVDVGNDEIDLNDGRR